jgi:primosomal protein N' (replication factor Y) (superfamily II helicase)
MGGPGDPLERLVAVAVDAPGTAGGRLYTYRLPPELSALEAGEAVIVPYARRQALGIVVEEAAAPVPARPLKTVVARVRADGPLVPPLALRLARSIAEHYLAPAALVLRQMLPGGLLERLELVVAPVPGPPTVEGLGEPLASRLATAPADGLPVASLPIPAAGRSHLLRELRAQAAAGRLRLSWTLRAPESRPKVERRVRLTEAGRAVQAGSPAGGARLGPRQRALLDELASHEGQGVEDPDAGDQGRPALAAARLASRHGGSAVSSLARRGLVSLESVIVERRPLAQRAPTARAARPASGELSPAQAAAAARIVGAAQDRRFEGFLLQGTTAAGKTAVYLTALETTLELGRPVLLLVPEIAQAAPLLDRLREALPGEPLALLHSATSEGERADEWRRIRAGGVRVVVGTRMAILAPLADVGLVVIDEEHDAAYKSDRMPRYQARDLALVLGRLAGAPVVLGSATPDVVSVGMARQGLLTHLRLPDRVTGHEPQVTVVDLRQELAEGNRGLISRALADGLAALDQAAGDRAILVLNRRGSSSVVLCRDCGYVQVCPECQRPLVYHAAGLVLRCHHCGASAPLARRCPACGSARIRYLGGGTEKLEAEVKASFPSLRVARLDRDVAARKGATERIIDAFVDGASDVLVGTSLVTKALDVPEVTLVGIVSADIALNLPDERAAERTYQLLRQAVGRAGRGERPGRAVIQTYVPGHPAIRAVASGDDGPFYETELAARRAFGAPPFGRLIKLTVSEPDRARAEEEGMRLAGLLRDRAAAAAVAGAPGGDTQVLGPAPAYIVRRAGRWRFNLVLRGRDPMAVLEDDPGAPWSVDVDPDSLL